MSNAVPPDGPDLEPVRRLPDLSWAGLVVLLAAEILALTLRFDGQTLLDDQQGWVAAVVARSHWLISFGVCASIMLVLALSGSVTDDRSGRRLVMPIVRGPRLWPYLLGQLGAYGCLVWLTGSLFEGGALASHPWGWAALWLAAVLATLSSWMLVARPLGYWERLVRDHWRVMAFAGLASIAALVLSVWTSSLWGLLHDSTSRAVRGVLGLFYADLVCRPDEFVLGTPRFEVGISTQCSGFEGMGLIWAFLGACFWWFRHELRFPHVLLLIPLGAALSWGFNVLRIAALIALGDRGWEAMAAGGFHSQAGWMAFNGIALGLVVVARRVPFFSRIAAVAPDQETPSANPTAAYVGPLLAMALATMITGTFAADGFDPLYAARVLAATAVLWSFRHHYGALRGVCSWHAVAMGLVVFAIWTALEPQRSSSEAAGAIHDGLGRMPMAWAWLVVRSIGSVVIVPLAEELAFRGYLTRRLIASDFLAVPEGRFTWPSFLLSSLLFGLLHQRWLAGTLAGMAYALSYYRRGKLIDAIAAHAMTNLLITITVFATGEWSRWS